MSKADLERLVYFLCNLNVDVFDILDRIFEFGVPRTMFFGEPDVVFI